MCFELSTIFLNYTIILGQDDQIAKVNRRKKKNEEKYQNYY